MPEPGGAGPYEWAVADQVLEGHDVSGDRCLIAPRGDGILVAVVDGLGHGEEAAQAACKALDTLAAHKDEDLPALVHRCHEALRRTRGAVMTVAALAGDGSLRWTGVGNVEAVVVRTDDRGPDHPVLLGGVLGVQTPKVRALELVLQPGDEVVFATDGVRRGFLDGLPVGPPQRTADDVLQRYATGRDDALVLVVRYCGDRP